MAYLKSEVDAGDVVEVSKYTNGRFGIKEVREKAPSRRATPDEQLKWQSKQAVKKVWRLLRNKMNFSPGDLWVTLTYPPKTKPTSEKVKGDINEFLKRLRRAYKKAGDMCKYIYSVGRGARGAIHLHFVLKKFDTEFISMTWQNIVNGGEWVHVHVEHLDRSRNWHKIASYIIKNGEETFLSNDPIIRQRFSSSRNLVMKKARAHIVHAKAWAKEPPERKGYYIDKNLSYDGVNRYGYPIQYTVYVRIQR